MNNNSEERKSKRGAKRKARELVENLFNVVQLLSTAKNIEKKMDDIQTKLAIAIEPTVDALAAKRIYLDASTQTRGAAREPSVSRSRSRPAATADAAAAAATRSEDDVTWSLNPNTLYIFQKNGRPLSPGKYPYKWVYFDQSRPGNAESSTIVKKRYNLVVAITFVGDVPKKNVDVKMRQLIKSEPGLCGQQGSFRKNSFNFRSLTEIVRYFKSSYHVATTCAMDGDDSALSAVNRQPNTGHLSEHDEENERERTTDVDKEIPKTYDDVYSNISAVDVDHFASDGDSHNSQSDSDE